MKKIRITSGVKTAIVVLNEIFALLLVVVLILTGSYGVNSGSWDDLLKHRTYEQSEYFKNQSFNQVTRAIRAAVRATRFAKHRLRSSPSRELCFPPRDGSRSEIHPLPSPPTRTRSD